MNKKGLIILFFAAFCLLGLYAFFWYKYKKSMDEVNKDWYEKEYLGKKISGVLKSIDQFNDYPFKVVLGVRNQGDKYDISYGVTCVDKEFIDFVQVGDSVFKMPGEKSMRFCKSKINCRNFELNFCNKYK